MDWWNIKRHKPDTQDCTVSDDSDHFHSLSLTINISVELDVDVMVAYVNIAKCAGNFRLHCRINLGVPSLKNQRSLPVAYSSALLWFKEIKYLPPPETDCFC